jgi:hypothetical protein
MVLAILDMKLKTLILNIGYIRLWNFFKMEAGNKYSKIFKFFNSNYAVKSPKGYELS